MALTLPWHVPRLPGSRPGQNCEKGSLHFVLGRMLCFWCAFLGLPLKYRERMVLATLGPCPRGGHGLVLHCDLWGFEDPGRPPVPRSCGWCSSGRLSARLPSSLLPPVWLRVVASRWFLLPLAASRSSFRPECSHSLALRPRASHSSFSFVLPWLCVHPVTRPEPVCTPACPTRAPCAYLPAWPEPQLCTQLPGPSPVCAPACLARAPCASLPAQPEPRVCAQLPSPCPCVPPLSFVRLASRGGCFVLALLAVTSWRGAWECRPGPRAGGMSGCAVRLQLRVGLDPPSPVLCRVSRADKENFVFLGVACVFSHWCEMVGVGGG